MMEDFLFWYAGPLVICLLGSWGVQILDKNNNCGSEIGWLGVVPGLNLVGAIAVFCMAALLVMSCLINLPSILRMLARKERV